LYPLWGITCFGEPYSRYDLCIIAWGGVVAQAIVAVPLLVWFEVFGYTRFQALNAMLAIFGFFSLSTGVFNLLQSGRSTARLPGVCSLRSLTVHPHAQPNANRGGGPGGEALHFEHDDPSGVRFRRMLVRWHARYGSLKLFGLG
jgi:hypothetical protein